MAADDDQQPAGGEQELLAERRRKLERLREAGVDPYPFSFHDRTGVSRVLEENAGLAAGEEAPDSRRVAGRLLARREHGKAAFLDLEDRSGRIQLYAREDVLGADSFERLVGLDLGDLIGVEGTPLRTKRGELSLRVDDWT